MTKPRGALFLAFHSSQDTDVASQLPDCVYTLKSDTEVGTALASAGFENVEISVEPKTKVRLARAIA